MVGISNAQGAGPILIYGVDPGSKAQAEFFLSAIREIDRSVPVLVGPDTPLNTGRFAGCSMLLIVGWTAGAREARKLAEFRKAFAQKPVVVFGRSGDPQARAEAFVAGADNYIQPDCTKPEIRAKMHRLLQLSRKSGMQAPPVRLRDLEIWLEEMIVLKNGRQVQLSQRELDMLIFLARAHPASVSRQTLEREVFGLRNDPGTNVVAVHMHRLRKKISADGDILKTIPGGYQLH